MAAAAAHAAPTPVTPAPMGGTTVPTPYGACPISDEAVAEL